MAAEVGQWDDRATKADTLLMTLTGTFLVNKNAHEVVLESKTIKWRRANKPNVEYQSVCFDDVLAVISGSAEADPETGADTNGSKKADSNTKGNVDHFTLHYIKRTPTHLWKPETVTFNVPENQSLGLTPWLGRIKGYITNSKLGRPKRLLVFVNPQSGGSKGVQIYDNKAAPLFKLAGVETDVTVTENGDQAGQVLSKYDLGQIDGVVAVGGDGTFLKCFDGLLKRVSHDAGIDVNDATATPVRPSIPVGIIPAGTGQGLIKQMTNTADPVTATLHIIMGERHALHTYSSYNGGKLLSFGAMLAAYGVFGDFIRISENSRNLGRARYMYAFGKALTSKRSFKAEIHYKAIPKENTVDASESEWNVVEGQFCNIHLYMLDLSEVRLEKKMKEVGFVPRDPKTPTMYLYWAIQECSRLRFIKAFIGSTTGDERAFDDHYFSLRPVKEFKIVLDIPELNEDTSCLNIDGEPNTLVDKTVHFKCHENLLPVFGAGVYKILGLDKLLEAAKEGGEGQPAKE